MSILTPTKPKPAGDPGLVARTLKNKADLAASALNLLVGQLGEAALENELGIDGAKDRLKNLQSEIAAKRSEVATLHAAHSEAVIREQAWIEESRKTIRLSQIRAAKKHLLERDRLAAQFSEAMVVAYEKYRLMRESAALAIRATPVGTEWPDLANDNFCSPNGLNKLVAAEIWRLCGDPAGKISLPGSNPPDAGYVHQPDKVPSMASRLAANTEFCLAAWKVKRED